MPHRPAVLFSGRFQPHHYLAPAASFKKKNPQPCRLCPAHLRLHPNIIRWHHGQSITPPDRISTSTHGSPFTISLKDVFDGATRSRRERAPAHPPRLFVEIAPVKAEPDASDWSGARCSSLLDGLTLQPAQLTPWPLVSNEIASIIPGEQFLPFTPSKGPPLCPQDASLAYITSSADPRVGTGHRAGPYVLRLVPWPPNTGSDLEKPRALGLVARLTGNTILDTPHFPDFRRRSWSLWMSVPLEARRADEARRRGVPCRSVEWWPWTRTDAWDHVMNMWQTAKNHDK